MSARGHCDGWEPEGGKKSVRQRCPQVRPRLRPARRTPRTSQTLQHSSPPGSAASSRPPALGSSQAQTAQPRSSEAARLPLGQMVLYMIGLGLGDERDITLRGLEAVKSCSKVKCLLHQELSCTPPSTSHAVALSRAA